MSLEAEDIVSVEMVPRSAEIVLPAFTAGAHIDLHLPNGLVRSYSLSNSQSETHRYVVTVRRDTPSRGGSAFVHAQLRVGSVIDISAPRNLFPLQEEAGHSVLVAGGIGITPLYSMLQRLLALGRRTTLLYFSRSAAAAAFVDAISSIEDKNLTVATFFDDSLQPRPALEALLKNFEANSHYYCCGPSGMLDAFVSTCARLGYENAHVERFAPPDNAQAAATAGGFTVELQRSGLSCTVQEGMSVLEAILARGVTVPFSCQEGICGACETAVIEGDIEHRDSLLTDQEKLTNATMMICVSGCKSKRLVLDL
jgi:tetrachlorobenzoquinone reductase